MFICQNYSKSSPGLTLKMKGGGEREKEREVKKEARPISFSRTTKNLANVC